MRFIDRVDPMLDHDICAVIKTGAVSAVLTVSYQSWPLMPLAKADK
jgi:hypothetical protein